MLQSALTDCKSAKPSEVVYLPMDRALFQTWKLQGILESTAFCVVLHIAWVALAIFVIAGKSCILKSTLYIVQHHCSAS